MDMCMVDVTAIACQPGDPVTVFGPERPLVDHARDMGTIPYEALTAVSQRVKRVFVHG
jgi:alanine racemase